MTCGCTARTNCPVARRLFQHYIELEHFARGTDRIADRERSEAAYRKWLAHRQAALGRKVSA